VIIIPVVLKEVVELDEAGVQVMKQVGSPAAPIPMDAVRVECDGVNYTVYEPGD